MLALAAVLTRRRGLMRGAVGAVYVVAALAVVASIVLLVALVTRDFSNHYVYSYTSRSLSLAYTVSAFWAGNAGSLLLWLLLMAVFSLVALRQIRREDPPSAPYVTAILLAITSVLLPADRVRARFQPLRPGARGGGSRRRSGSEPHAAAPGHGDTPRRALPRATWASPSPSRWPWADSWLAARAPLGCRRYAAGRWWAGSF